MKKVFAVFAFALAFAQISNAYQPFVSGQPMTTGQVIVGVTGAAPIAETLTGTANQITITPSSAANTVTFSMPSSVSMTNLTVTGTLSPWTTGTLTTTGNMIVTGNAGIGTTNPTRQLDIVSAVAPTAYITQISSQDLTSLWKIAGNGNLYIGADNVASVSTITSVGAATFKTSVAAPALSGTTSITGGTIAGTSGALSTTLAVQGATYLGANASATVSTITAAGVATFAASVTAPALTGSTSVAGGTVAGTTAVSVSAGYIGLYSRSTTQLMAITPTAVGQMYYDNVVNAVVVSTGTSAGNFALASGATW